MSLKFGATMPWKYWTWKLAETTGWTLEYIRSLTMQDYHDYLQIKDARLKAGIR